MVEMSHREFQDYVGLLGRLLRLRTAQREAIEEELRAHMEERFAALSSQGIEPEQAVSMALAEFGDAAALAAEFTAISRLQKRRWMMRFTIGSIAATILLTAVAVSIWPNQPGELAENAAQAQQVEQPAPPTTEAPPPPSAEQRADEQSANADTEAKLEELVPVEFVETPLQDVLDFLKDMVRVPVYIDRRALNDVGIDPSDAPITINLKKIPAEMALRLVLRQHKLAYMLDHGVVIVTTAEEAETQLDVRVYRVSDLLEEAADGNAVPPADWDMYYEGYAPGEPGGAMRAVDRYGEMGKLINLITATVEPSSWDTVGGPGSIVPYRGTLVIAQTQQVHRKVEKLLKGLREALAK